MQAAFPINYKLEFEPLFKNFTFKGKETITIFSKKPISSLKIHAAELRIQHSSIKIKDQQISARTKLDEKNEILHVIFGKKIQGEFMLNLEFTGILNDRLLGFYRSKYVEKGKTKYLATTQFEAADARRAF
ncbi:MAG: M1 family peptidase, partial [Nitrosopumilaceae archaeon]|nr:M1 family peptidase [Nitrosopumilaceae archaeon]